MARRKVLMTEIERSTVEVVAQIMGPFSACAQALDDAAKHDGPVKFYQTTNNSIVVEKLPKER